MRPTRLHVLALLVLVGCGGDSGPIFNFKATEVVDRATPDSLDMRSGPAGAWLLTPELLLTRFQDDVYLNTTGFTMDAILQRFDDRLDLANQSGASGCLSGSPEGQALVMPDGRSVDIYAECHTGSATQFLIFGMTPDAAWTIYERGPAGTMFLRATETAPDAGTFDLDAYYSVFPQSDGSGSRVLAHVHANDAAGVVQWTGAYGGGICGVTTYADSEKIYLQGSANDATQGGLACAAELSAVYDTLDLAPDATTPFDASMVYSGSDFIRRNAGTQPLGPSDPYPTGGNVNLTHGATSATDLTDLNFGPDTIDELGSTAL